MRRSLIMLLPVVLLATGCATEVRRHFTMTVDPPDAEIKVVPGGGRPELRFVSPADIIVNVPKDPDLASQGRIEIRRERYKPRVINLGGIEEGEALAVKLERLVHYTLRFRLAGPTPSDELRYTDREVDISFAIGERQIDLKLTNRTAKLLRILWDRSEFTDHVNRRHRVMHSGIRPQDRNNPIPPLVVRPGETAQLAVMPLTSVVYSPEKKGYETKLLLPVDSDLAVALKGRIISLFLPVEIDRAIIPTYNFRFQIADAVKD